LILVIDTSSSIAMLATIDNEEGGVIWFVLPSRSDELIPNLRRMAAFKPVTGVAVATGPGSFTGLRVGVSFGLGLAIGLGVPIFPLPTLDLQAARSDAPVTAVVEAGRGRFYFQVAGAQARLGEAAEMPLTYPLVGRLSTKGQAALEAAGHVFELESEMRSPGEAAMKLLETAREVAYGSLKLEYMQAFTKRA
jgi:tRNA threonylcarbamoyl adenosine modification protein YeaZ